LEGISDYQTRAEKRDDLENFARRFEVLRAAPKGNEGSFEAREARLQPILFHGAMMLAGEGQQARPRDLCAEPTKAGGSVSAPQFREIYQGAWRP
jgi:hypothetical protein